MKESPLKTEQHHWWPRTLAGNWTAADGMVSVVRPNGDIHRAPAGSFGAITNAHHIKLGGSWDSTFEPLFNQPDSEITDFVRWLSTLEASLANSDAPMIERIRPQPLTSERQQQIARIIGSLLARSPSIRNSIRLGTEYFRREMGMTDPRPGKSLIAANQRGLYAAYRKKLEATGRWAILFSDEKEFIAGDGFLHDFPASLDGIGSGTKLILPILPTATVVYMSPMGYPSEPRLVTLRVNANDVEELNRITPVYCSDFIFFRDCVPDIIDSFRIGQHQVFQHGVNDWLASLLDDLSQFCLWGKGGSPAIGGRRPYTENLQGNRWLEEFSAKRE